MTGRTCRCGCGASLDGRRRDCVFATSTCAREYSRGESAAQRGKPRAGGVQLSWGPAVEAVAWAYSEEGHAAIHWFDDEAGRRALAEWILKRAVPDAQRQRLESR